MKIFFKLYRCIPAFARLSWLLSHFGYGFFLLSINRFRSGDDWFYSEKGAEIIRKWMWRGSRILGLNIVVSGTACRGSSVLVSNHISWLDIVAIAATTPVTFVSKSDLRRWPIVGTLAEMTGTLFIKRGSLFSVHKTLSYLKEIISLGRKVVFFPEGTTTRGEGVNKFNSGLFQSAAISNCPVQPMAISYYIHDLPDREIAPYVDDDHFIKHLWKLLLNGKLDVQLDFLDEVDAKKHSRYELAKHCQTRISELIETSAAINADYPVDVTKSGYVLLN